VSPRATALLVSIFQANESGDALVSFSFTGMQRCLVAVRCVCGLYWCWEVADAEPLTCRCASACLLPQARRQARTPYVPCASPPTARPHAPVGPTVVVSEFCVPTPPSSPLRNVIPVSPHFLPIPLPSRRRVGRWGQVDALVPKGKKAKRGGKKKVTRGPSGALGAAVSLASAGGAAGAGSDLAEEDLDAALAPHVTSLSRSLDLLSTLMSRWAVLGLFMCMFA
jgi:hypothetical protein